MAIPVDALRGYLVGGCALVLAALVILATTWGRHRAVGARAALPAIGDGAVVVTHVGPTGGYVQLGSLIVWAYGEGPSRYPSQECPVVEVTMADGVPTLRIGPATVPRS